MIKAQNTIIMKNEKNGISILSYIYIYHIINYQ